MNCISRRPNKAKGMRGKLSTKFYKSTPYPIIRTSTKAYT
jgi:hypothetical protein